jgi:hypothetical protein
MPNNVKNFKEKGYCIVKSAISDELRDFITQYALFDEMQDSSIGDSQVPGAHFKYADPAMETVLLNLQSVMEENTGLKLFPTYSYYRVYRAGDDLKAHKDRESCEISATLCFNYSYDDKKINWPIFMEGNKVILKPGDMVIYRGCDLAHWRENFTASDDDWHVQGFFHYVDQNGPYANFKYDQRSSVGEKKLNYKVNNTQQKSYIQYTN